MIADLLREWRIKKAYNRFLLARNLPDQQKYLNEFYHHISQRSPAHIRRMEKQRGLA